MQKTYCPGMERQTTRFTETLNHIYMVVFNLITDFFQKLQERIPACYFLKGQEKTTHVRLTKRVKHWPRRLSSCPLLLVCRVHLSHQMCLCAASNTRCTQCWKALEKYIQRLDRALALSQQSEVGMATAVQSPPRPLLPRQPPSLFKNAPCLPYIGSCHHR